jgi:hypothetical protein
VSSRGCLIYAFNNEEVDYILTAYEAARRVKHFLGIPVCLVTDSSQRVDEIDIDGSMFDIVVDVWKNPEIKSIAELLNSRNLREYADGSMSFKKSNFKNSVRTKTYELTPFDETLVIDSDYMLANDLLKYCWQQPQDFLIYRQGYDMTDYRTHPEFDRVSDYTVDFYWATAFWFRKTHETKIFFDLIDHIRENWDYYRLVYQFSSHMYRNDHAFSIALHIINGYTGVEWAGKMPGRMLYTLDRDVLVSMNDREFRVLLEKQDRLGEYTLQKITGSSLHIMNKFSLLRAIRGENNE